MNQLKGIHHITAITSSAEKIYEFFTYTLGLRLVKKTINQDDINTYHLFFADDKGNPGTDMTFFDFKGIQAAKKGTDEIGRVGFRVASDQAIEYWKKRFDFYSVSYEDKGSLFGTRVLYFEDFDQQEYALFSDEFDQGVAPGEPWYKGPVPDEYAIIGLGPIFLRTRDYNRMHRILTSVYEMKQMKTEDHRYLFEMGEGGNGARVIVEHITDLPMGQQGYGAVHHVAFRIEDKTELDEWVKRYNNKGVRHSGYVDRFYFKSLYARAYPYMLFELATEGPGFIDDEEPYETLGEILALPPKFRDARSYVESVVRHIDTVRSTKTFEKEYFE
jgi:glyoxalase family protein